MDGNFGEQKKEVPAPPAPEISIRTMESDIKAITQGGGEMPVTQTFSQPQGNSEKKFEVAGYAGSEKPIFSPAPGILPNENSAESAGEKTNWVKSLFMMAIIIIGIIVAGLLGYFIFSNWVFPAQMPSVNN